MNPPSLASRIIRRLLFLTRTKQRLGVEWLQKNGRYLHEAQPPHKFGGKYQINAENFNQRPVWTMRPSHQTSQQTILFLHGGAYVQNFKPIHWSFIGSLIDELGCTVVAPDYPLAPEDEATAVFSMLIPLYQQLVTQIGAENIVIMGDSAGGGLALALAQHLLVEQLPQPAQSILLCPWLDIGLTNPAILPLEKLDPILSIAGLRECGLAYAGSLPLTDYRVSPLYGPMSGLVPVTMFTSTHELLNPDCHRLQQQLTAVGQTGTLYEYAGLVHDWMFFNLPETKQTRAQLLAILQ